MWPCRSLLGGRADVGFPPLLPWTVELCLVALAVIMGINLRGVVASARLFILPTAVFVLAIATVIVIGLLSGAPLHPLPTPTQPATMGSVGVLLVLAAFANGCSALTGVEAIANATPAFQRPRQLRARHAEAALGLILGLLLIGLAVVVERFTILPVPGRSLLSLVTEGSLGAGWPYLTVQLVTMLLLALAANTSFGGLPVLAARLASDAFLPHLFGLRADRLVHRHGVVVLAVLAGALLGAGAPVRRRSVHRVFPVPDRHGQPLASAPRPRLASARVHQRPGRAGHRDSCAGHHGHQVHPRRLANHADDPCAGGPV
jgi:amino acid transporter